jgi:hypothetical protein
MFRVLMEVTIYPFVQRISIDTVLLKTCEQFTKFHKHFQKHVIFVRVPSTLAKFYQL